MSVTLSVALLPSPHYTGELSVNDDGLNKYKTLYIDPIAQQLAAYPNVRVALVIEPDSLPNLATNLGVQKCQEAKVTEHDQQIKFRTISATYSPFVALFVPKCPTRPE